jgi:hypothetical protein
MFSQISYFVARSTQSLSALITIVPLSTESVTGNAALSDGWPSMRVIVTVAMSLPPVNALTLSKNPMLR